MVQDISSIATAIRLLLYETVNIGGCSPETQDNRLKGPDHDRSRVMTPTDDSNI